MSLTYSQIKDTIDSNVGSSSVSYSDADKNRDINLALDRVLALIFGVGGTWQFDDSGHADFPIITTNIVSGQRDYTFVEDEQGNLVLDVWKVMVADENGNFRILPPVDVSRGNAPSNYYDGLEVQGDPSSYDKLANGIFLDQIPDYNYTNGLKVYISREGSYFTTSDTTKKPGFAGLFHEYLALRPSYFYAIRNSLPIANALRGEMIEMENALMDYYKQREKDEVKMLIAQPNNAR